VRKTTSLPIADRTTQCCRGSPACRLRRQGRLTPPGADPIGAVTPPGADPSAPSHRPARTPSAPSHRPAHGPFVELLLDVQAGQVDRVGDPL